MIITFINIFFQFAFTVHELTGVNTNGTGGEPGCPSPMLAEVGVPAVTASGCLPPASSIPGGEYAPRMTPPTHNMVTPPATPHNPSNMCYFPLQGRTW